VTERTGNQKNRLHYFHSVGVFEGLFLSWASIMRRRSIVTADKISNERKDYHGMSLNDESSQR